MPGVRIDQATQTFTVTQSWLQDFLRCPEKARRQIADPRPSLNDATATGLAVHRFMELRLLGKSYAEANTEAIGYLADLTAESGFTWEIVKTPDTLFNHLDACVVAMDRHVLPQVPPGGQVEHKSSAPLAIHQGWQIRLEGTPDYVDPFLRCWDWKTSRDDYNVHEANNWMIQPTAYTYLASQMLHADVCDFTYAIAIKPSGVIQLLDVVRGPNDWDWLAKIARDALDLTLALPDSWPVHHGHWLCSPRWCPYWDTCRGLYVNPHSTPD